MISTICWRNWAGAPSPIISFMYAWARLNRAMSISMTHRSTTRGGVAAEATSRRQTVAAAAADADADADADVAGVVDATAGTAWAGAPPAGGTPGAAGAVTFSYSRRVAGGRSAWTEPLSRSS